MSVIMVIKHCVSSCCGKVIKDRVVRGGGVNVTTQRRVLKRFIPFIPQQFIKER